MCDFPHHVRMLFSPLHSPFRVFFFFFSFFFFLLPLSLCDSRRLLHPYREALSSVDFWEASGTGLWPVARNRLREEAHNGKALGLSCATRNSFIFSLVFFPLFPLLSAFHPRWLAIATGIFSFRFRSVFASSVARVSLFWYTGKILFRYSGISIDFWALFEQNFWKIVTLLFGIIT